MFAISGLVPSASAEELEGPELWLPTANTDDVAWTDTYGDARGGGRTHKGVDMMGPQMTPVYAAESGYIRRAYGGDSRECLDGAYCSDYGMLIYGDSGWSQFYLHFNDDTPGRPNGCDHVGGVEHAFSPRLVDILRDRGTLEPLPYAWRPEDVVRVERGELLGWIGSSGNAGCRVDHLHFELWQGHDFKSANDPTKTNPTPYVDEAVAAGRYWGPEGPIEPVPTDRLSGPTRVSTSVALSREAFEASDIAFIAPAEHHVEALVAAPLGAAVEAPVLLTWGTPIDGELVVEQALVDEIERLGSTRIVLVGSTNHLDERLEDVLADRTGVERDQILRFGEPDPWSLSRAIAEELLYHHGWGTDAGNEPQSSGSGPPEDAEEVGPWLLQRLAGEEEQPRSNREQGREPLRPVVALGAHEDPNRAWPDALAAATLAAGELQPVLLVRGDDLPDEIAEVLDHEGMDDVRIVGGEAAVSAGVEQQIRDAGHATSRLAGADRIETALAVAREIEANGGSPVRVFAATAHNFPDALAAAGTVARLGRVLVLVDGLGVQPGAVEDWLRERAGNVERMTAVGGTGVITARTLRRLAVHANWPIQDDEGSDGA